MTELKSLELAHKLWVWLAENPGSLNSEYPGYAKSGIARMLCSCPLCDHRGAQGATCVASVSMPACPLSNGNKGCADGVYYVWSAATTVLRGPSVESEYLRRKHIVRLLQRSAISDRCQYKGASRKEALKNVARIAAEYIRDKIKADLVRVRCPIIRKGQLWQEADKRHTRIVEVLAVDGDVITIQTVSDTYGAARKRPVSKAKRSRFKSRKCTSHCGYFLVKESTDDKSDDAS